MDSYAQMTLNFFVSPLSCGRFLEARLRHL